jgi:outer membrane protein assembly factor BamB
MKKQNLIFGSPCFLKLIIALMIIFLVIVGCGGGDSSPDTGGEVGSLEWCLSGCVPSDSTCRLQCYAIWGSPDDDSDDSVPDEIAPSTPTNFIAEAISYNQVNLSWNQSTDNESGGLRYEVYKNGLKYFVDVSKTDVSDMPTVSSSTNNCYSVLSCDSSDNCSDLSSEVCITTPENPHFKWSYTTGVYFYNLIVATDGTIYASHTNSNTDGILYAINANGTLKWSYPDIDHRDLGLIGNDGTVYARSSNDENLYAINDDGTLKWSYNVGETFSSPYLTKVGDSIIYMGSDDTLLAINDDGTLRWSSSGFSNAVVASIGDDGTVYVQTKVDYRAVLNAVGADGTLKWSRTIGYDLDTLLYATDGTIYALVPNTLFAINTDGTIKWSFSDTNSSFSPNKMAIGSDGTAYLSGGPDQTLYAISTDGSLKWSYFIGYSFSNSSPLIGSDGIIYMGSGDTLLAINDDGTLRWDYTTEGIQALHYYISNPYSVWSLQGFTAEMSPAIIDSFGTVYVKIAGTLLAINPAGTLKWSYTTGSYLISPPVIDSDGTVYVGSYDNNLYALQQ